MVFGNFMVYILIYSIYFSIYILFDLLQRINKHIIHKSISFNHKTHKFELYFATTII
jgi:hypothetical protein